MSTRAPIEHVLKCLQPYFNDVLYFHKTFEYRAFDRDFRVGDTLRLQEYVLAEQRHTGQECVRRISYVLLKENYEPLPAGYAILGLSPIHLIQSLEARITQLEKLQAASLALVEKLKEYHKYVYYNSVYFREFKALAKQLGVSDE
jgi:hypothetical protein